MEESLQQSSANFKLRVAYAGCCKQHRAPYDVPVIEHCEPFASIVDWAPLTNSLIAAARWACDAGQLGEFLSLTTIPHHHATGSMH